MKKILLVEDNKGITEGLCDIFTEPEYKLYTAKNIKEAGELLSQCSPGLVLLDVGLPDGDGFEFYKKHLAKYFPDGSRLIVTDFSFQSDGIWR